MKRVFATALVLGLLFGAMSATASARPSWRIRQLRFGMDDGKPAWSPREVTRAIYYAERRWPVAAGYSTVMCIAQRESGLRPGAQNPTSSARGIFQFVDGTWASVYHGMPDAVRWYHVGYDRSNARNSVIVGVRVMAHQGLGPWGYGC